MTPYSDPSYLLATATGQDAFQVWMAIVAGGSALFTLLSSLFVLSQVWLLKRQLKFEALTQIKAINRDLITLGFDHPDLFKVIQGKSRDSEKARRYLQLWINQIDLVYHAKTSKLLTKGHLEGLETDIADFFSMELARTHWANVRDYYPEGLQRFIENIIRARNATGTRELKNQAARSSFSENVQ